MIKRGSVLVREDGVKFKASEINTYSLVLSMLSLDPAEDRVRHLDSNN